MLKLKSIQSNNLRIMVILQFKPCIMKRSALFLLSIIFFSSSCIQDTLTKNEKINYKEKKEIQPAMDSVRPEPRPDHGIKNLEIPLSNPSDKIIHHTGYSLLYNELHEQAAWVAYELTKVETVKISDRTDKFIVDPGVSTGSADDKDYSGSGFDRGHLAPAADMGWSATTMKESFYFSNMSPQVPSFNRGIWKKLEEQVRTWANEYDTLYIVTGPVLTNGLPVIGQNQVSVPKYYYKVILDYTEPGINGIGFLMPNASSGLPLQEFAVSIDSVEKVTGIDFFYLLPDSNETQIEKSLCVDCWMWKTRK